MENASKALLMAAGVLMSLIIIGAFMLMMSYLNGYQGEVEQSKKDAQLTEFNVLFDTYNRQNIRGNEMISLMNRIVDYNSRKTDEGWPQFRVLIKIPKEIRDKLKYEGNSNIYITNSEYNQDAIINIVGKANKPSKIQEIESTYEAKYATQLAKQISNISDIIDNDNYGRTPIQKAKTFNNKGWLPKDLDKYGKNIDAVFNDAKIYYEYVQFKRTRFDCTQVFYNEGRINYMSFKCTGIGE